MRVAIVNSQRFRTNARGRLGHTIAAKIDVLTGEHGNYSQIIARGSSLFTQFMITFALLKTFNTNTLNFHKYFKNKLSFHQPVHIHNTRHRTNNDFNTPIFNHSKTQKCYLYQVIPIFN